MPVRLRQLLHGGLIPSKALLSSGKPIDIDEYIWAGENAPEIFETGTVFVEIGELRAPGPGGKTSETAYVLLDRQETEKAMKGEVPKGAVQSRADIQAKCKIWLKLRMEASPDQRVDTKDNLYLQAFQEFSQLGNLAREAFNQAWHGLSQRLVPKRGKPPGVHEENKSPPQINPSGYFSRISTCIFFP